VQNIATKTPFPTLGAAFRKGNPGETISKEVASNRARFGLMLGGYGRYLW
jgi:hypothetical protein